MGPLQRWMNDIKSQYSEIQRIADLSLGWPVAAPSPSVPSSYQFQPDALGLLFMSTDRSDLVKTICDAHSLLLQPEACGEIAFIIEGTFASNAEADLWGYQLRQKLLTETTFEPGKIHLVLFVQVRVGAATHT